jgi:hypothetical protein
MFTSQLFDHLSAETLAAIVLDLGDTQDEGLIEVMLDAGGAMDGKLAAATTDA